MKALDYWKFTGVASIAQVRAFEEIHRVTLPRDYVEFITTLGVGLPSDRNTDYVVPLRFRHFYEGYMFGSNAECVVDVSEFPPLVSTGGREGMDRQLGWVRNPLDWPEDKLPIGTNLDGDYFALTSAESSPVFFWDKESCEFYEIADSFEQFVEALTSFAN